MGYCCISTSPGLSKVLSPQLATVVCQGLGPRVQWTVQQCTIKRNRRGTSCVTFVPPASTDNIDCASATTTACGRNDPNCVTFFIELKIIFTFKSVARLLTKKTSLMKYIHKKDCTQYLFVEEEERCRMRIQRIKWQKLKYTNRQMGGRTD